MNDIAGVLIALRNALNEKFASVGGDSEELASFQKMNDPKFLEHDCYILFDRIMESGIREMYEHEEKTKKRGRSQKMYGRPNYSNVKFLPYVFGLA